MTPIEQLEKLVEARKKATAGKWRQGGTDDDFGDSDLVYLPSGDWLTQALKSESDADFIALAGSLDLPALLAHVKAMEQVCAAAFTANSEMCMNSLKGCPFQVQLETALALLDGKGGAG